MSVFSALDHGGIHEQRGKTLTLKHDPDLSVVCFQTVGRPSFLARANGTILNALILCVAQRTIRGYCFAMSKLGLRPLYLTQKDGNLTDATAAAELPITTFASGANK